jgi:2-polyprenyl-3-methyl-5-hydroxy-6-metoxy-1,4-benzoquinol methylase
VSLPDVKSYYWNWLEHADDPAYEQGIDAVLTQAEQRLAPYIGSRQPADVELLLRMVDAELGREDTFTERLRRDRWKQKIETVTRTLREGQAVLDCGSGFGTESIAFALGGARVTAVDVFPVYLQLVRKRAEMYGRLFGVDLVARITCVAAHLPVYQPEQRFDVIWSNESIEHIAPLGQFFSRLKGWLSPGGRVVICNDNVMSPIRLLATIRARGSLRARYETRTVPGVADSIEYGVEVIRSPLSTTRMLAATGLPRVECTMMSIFPSRLVRSNWMYKFAQIAESIARVPGVRLFAAGDFILVARPAAE